jgi:Helix-hairpin-helix motif.
MTIKIYSTKKFEEIIALPGIGKSSAGAIIL